MPSSIGNSAEERCVVACIKHGHVLCKRTLLGTGFPRRFRLCGPQFRWPGRRGVPPGKRIGHVIINPYWAGVCAPGGPGLAEVVLFPPQVKLALNPLPFPRLSPLRFLPFNRGSRIFSRSRTLGGNTAVVRISLRLASSSSHGRLLSSFGGNCPPAGGAWVAVMSSFPRKERKERNLISGLRLREARSSCLTGI